jgi:hypothetical protein
VSNIDQDGALVETFVKGLVKRVKDCEEEARRERGMRLAVETENVSLRKRIAVLERKVNRLTIDKPIGSYEVSGDPYPGS